MRCCALGLILLVLHVIASSANRFKHQGNWTEVEDSSLLQDQYARYYVWHGPTNGRFDDSAALLKEFKQSSTCRALSIRDNCFSHNPDRALHLLKRQWKLHSKPKWFVDVTDPSALPHLISEFQNKTIVFLGDSTVLSVFTSLVCYLSMYTTAENRLIWTDDQDHILTDAKGQTKCPYHTSCYLLAGVVYFPEYHITITYDQVNNYDKRSAQLMHSIIEHAPVRPHVVIINIGIHYNEMNSFIHELWILKGDIRAIVGRQKATNTTLTSWHWLENFPQHFANLNGFFNEGDYRVLAHTLEDVLPKEAGGPAVRPELLHCIPHLNLTESYHNDWRNRLPEQIMHEFHSSHRTIRIAEPLYSQWDAHVDYGDSRRVLHYPADCTHYCTGSGVFRFVLSEVVSSIKKCLHGCADDMFF